MTAKSGLKNKLSTLREERAKGEHGFTLIELLVVVVIIGILVAIAIPVYLNFRKGAENRSAQSDVRNAVTTIEQCFNDNSQVYPASFAASSTPVTLSCGTGNTGEVVNVSSGNTVQYTLSGKNYVIRGINTDSGKIFSYDSTTGLITNPAS